MPSLQRTRDGAGDSGAMSMALWQEDGEIKYEHGARPRVGVAMRVGSISGRSYSSQDWWQTTLITEILSESEEEIHFRTGNSEYIWKP